MEAQTYMPKIARILKKLEIDKIKSVHYDASCLMGERKAPATMGTVPLRDE